MSRQRLEGIWLGFTAALIIACLLYVAYGADDGISKCMETHSYDVCFSTLH
ncbi:MAG: hypothetical protein P4L79_10125 [Legionella sp.]|uniref:hypothetical protein n=1 Tax=Legionella sp. TaxID=459 RepID=UPI002844EC04|nr:hypothetical protein [Legionella sp.]